MPASIVIYKYKPEAVTAALPALQEQAQEIIVVTRNPSQSWDGVQMVNLPANLPGTLPALLAGIEAATHDIVAIMDAKALENPSTIVQLSDYLPLYKMAVGTRSTSESLRNRFMKRLTSYLSSAHVGDLKSGYVVIQRALFFEYAHLLPRDYLFTTTLAMALLREGYPVAWVELENMHDDTEEEMPVRTPREFLRFFGQVLNMIMLFSPQKIFVPIGIGLLVIGIGVAIYTMLLNFLQPSAVLLVMMGIFIFLFGLVSEQMAVIRRESGR